jgi:hypothetical protein
MPAGELVTVPDPVPVLVTVSLLRLNVAVTVVSEFMVTVQDPVPLHPPPDQPTKADVASGVAVSVTTVPGIYFSVQSTPQLSPAGALVTAPEPDFVMLSVFVKMALIL